MSYQVLARKWRPRVFAELVGQQHVVRALSHALDSGRIHHAFLFTGTRGVGKTTIARIFAKSLNCETGISSTPCGLCSACVDINAGRFMDLLEIDAASNTGVDDVRSLIENAQYAPARGRMKVYLIDEVHMLSKPAFNALLKTLEEPPAHVKFLLATTDPQRLPVTVLSRCLQFNLKRLTIAEIETQLSKILLAEGIAHDPDSIREIARGGNGSVRDALSLLDQAIAFGGGQLIAAEVRSMLGTLDRGGVVDLLDAIVANDAVRLAERIAASAEFQPDFANVLDALAEFLHGIQVAQLLPSASPEDVWPVGDFVARIAPETVQLFYQLTIAGRRDLPLAPSARIGFEMCLLRMLAFQPQPPHGSRLALPTLTMVSSEQSARAEVRGDPSVQVVPSSRVSGVAGAMRTHVAAQPSAVLAAVPMALRAVLEPAAVPTVAVAAVTPDATENAVPTLMANGPLDAVSWAAFNQHATLRGPTRELAANLVFIEDNGRQLRLGVIATMQHLQNDLSLRGLRDALSRQLGRELCINIETIDDAADAPAAIAARARREKQSEAETALQQSPFVQRALSELNARILFDTIQPIEAQKDEE